MTWLDSPLAGVPMFEDDLTVLVRGEAVRVLSGIPDTSVDLILADPTRPLYLLLWWARTRVVAREEFAHNQNGLRLCLAVPRD